MEPLQSLAPKRFETVQILLPLARASRQLAELKGVASSIPNQDILINTLGLQEAKDSSAVENIVTTHDELFREAATPDRATAAAKEVARYRHALFVGREAVAKNGLLTTNQILAIQKALEPAKPGFRKVPGTTLKSGAGDVIYTPPPPNAIPALMSDLDHFVNDAGQAAIDPLVKMALIHHQFESIHPFYDGNGRAGRIISVLYLVQQRLLDIPVLYLSRHIVRTKTDYYRLLQDVRDRDAWEDWVIYMLTAVEATATEGISTVKAIREALMTVKHRVRNRFKFYSQDLINNLFTHPYTKIDFVQKDLGVTRITATKYLEELVKARILRRVKVGRSYYYINIRLVSILTGRTMTDEENGFK